MRNIWNGSYSYRQAARRRGRALWTWSARARLAARRTGSGTRPAHTRTRSLPRGSRARCARRSNRSRSTSWGASGTRSTSRAARASRPTGTDPLVPSLYSRAGTAARPACALERCTREARRERGDALGARRRRRERSTDDAGGGGGAARTRSRCSHPRLRSELEPESEWPSTIRWSLRRGSATRVAGAPLVQNSVGPELIQIATVSRLVVKL